MELEALKTKLRESEVGEYIDFGGNDGHVDASPETINKVLSDLSGDNIEITEDINGCDMDWSYDLEFEGMEFDTWGSVHSGSFMLQKQES